MQNYSWVSNWQPRQNNDDMDENKNYSQQNMIVDTLLKILTSASFHQFMYLLIHIFFGISEASHFRKALIRAFAAYVTAMEYI